MQKKKQKIVRKVALATLGCKVNQFESASFQSGFEEKGLTLVPFSQAADVYVINTCAVTSKAGAQSRQMIRRALRANPEAHFVVTGCYAQVASEEIKKLTDLPVSIIGNSRKDLLIETVVSEQRQKEQVLIDTDIRAEKEISRLPVRHFSARTRAFLKVQDGCNNFCSYCIVPYARGRSRSQPIDDVVRQVEIFSIQGYRELVVTGIHVGAYGRDLKPPTDLLALLKVLTSQTPEMRYRISSLEPTEISENLLLFMAAAGNLMPHFHIPLQSGDDGILKKMNRRYKAREFAATVTKIARYMPDVGIGVDVLVGFPGESTESYERTLQFLAALPVTYLHVFPYSRRPSTPAAEMADQLPRKIKEERVARLRELDNKKRIKFYKSQLGKVHRVLVEGKRDSLGFLKGFTENYVPVLLQAPPHYNNQVVSVRLKSIQDKRVLGELQE